MSTHPPRLSLLALALALAPLAVACGTPSDDASDSSQQNVSASEANAKHEMRPLLEDVRAGRAAERLGIARWDVFSGTSKSEGFEGAVFYASDERGDVKVFFAFDNKTKAYAVGQLDPEGRPVTTPLDRTTLDALFLDIADLRDRARRQATRDCATGVGVAALSGVLAAGVAIFTGVPAAIATGAVSGIAVSGATADILLVIGAYVGVQGGVVAAVGIASSAAVAAATDVVDSCGDALNGIGGDAPSP